MKKPTHLIINNPSAAPRRHWRYDRQRQSFDLARYSKNVLIVAPGLTVRKRLEVLKPEGPDNYFNVFGVVPESLMQSLRSHVSHCVYDRTWEAAKAHWLDHKDTAGTVSAWAKNDHLGFEIRYLFAGGVAKDRPDFLVRLTSGRVLILEVKGQDTPRDKARCAALGEWVDAVNADGRFGRWCCDVSRTPSDVLDILKKHATG